MHDVSQMSMSRNNQNKGNNKSQWNDLNEILNPFWQVSKAHLIVYGGNHFQIISIIIISKVNHMIIPFL